jgi:hypothetical protein
MACVSMKTMQQARRPKCRRHVIGQTGTFMSSTTTTYRSVIHRSFPKTLSYPEQRGQTKKTGTEGGCGLSLSGGIRRNPTFCSDVEQEVATSIRAKNRNLYHFLKERTRSYTRFSADGPTCITR